MNHIPVHNENAFGRRHFISNTLKLAVAGNLLSLELACNSKPVKPTATDSVALKNKGNNHHDKSSKTRKKWNHEKLILNTKTHVLHLPTAATYVYYDEIKHLQEVSLANWENQLQDGVRLNKEKSGNMLETLALQKLRGGVDDTTLASAIDTLAKAFGPLCSNAKGDNCNTTNYRLHELMLQLLALNSAIPGTAKWLAFNEKTKRPAKLGKRQKWMETEAAFNERVAYITAREAEYKTRLSQWASKYSIT